MYPVRFHTNLDLVPGDKHGWPESLPFRPMVGDRIVSPHIHVRGAAFSGTISEGLPYQLELEIHSVKIVVDDKAKRGHSTFSHFEVELHLPKQGIFSSVKQFYDHYEKITGWKFI